MQHVCVITGGAGGMGLATARIVGHDHRVVISDVDQDRLDAAAVELEKVGIRCAAVRCDITEQSSVRRLVEAAAALGTVTAIIHTAGVSPSMGTAELIMRVNAIGTVNVNEAFYRNATEPFVIVNVASMAAHMMPEILIPKRRFSSALRDEDTFMKKMMSVCRAVPTKSRPGLAYSISKSFVVWYSASQAVKFGEHGARILSVSPGSIDTAMGRLEESRGAGAMARHSALKRFGKPEEVAELLAFCASEKAGYLTGVDILCDGGTVTAMTWRDKLTAGRDRRRAWSCRRA